MAHPTAKSLRVGASPAATTLDRTPLTVPEGTVVRILYVHVEVTTVAGGGVRQINMQWKDENGILVYDTKAGITQAGGTLCTYSFTSGVPRETAIANQTVLVPIPGIACLLPNWSIRIFDENTIDSDDNEIITVTYLKFGHTEIQDLT